MPKSIPVKQAEGFAVANDLQQVIIFGHDAEGVTHVLTWGDTVERSAQAAAGANAIKKKWGWPDAMQAESAKVIALQAENAELLARVKEMELRFYHSPRANPTVHIIEGTEYERGWGCRPDGYVAFTSKADAEAYIAEYNEKYNNLKSAPDEYTTYEYKGIHDCSDAFMRLVIKKSKHFFTRKSEMLE